MWSTNAFGRTLWMSELSWMLSKTHKWLGASICMYAYASFIRIHRRSAYYSFPLPDLYLILQKVFSGCIAVTSSPTPSLPVILLKARIAIYGIPMTTELRDVTCHGITGCPTHVNAPRPNPSLQAGTRFTYPGGMEGWVDLVFYTSLLPFYHCYKPILLPTVVVSRVYSESVRQDGWSSTRRRASTACDVWRRCCNSDHVQVGSQGSQRHPCSRTLDVTTHWTARSLPASRGIPPPSYTQPCRARSLNY